MERYLKRKEKLYILLIIVATICAQLIVYAIGDFFGYRAHLLTPGFIDNMISLKTIFIYPYIFWYVMLILVPYVIGLKDEKQFKKYILSIFVCEVIALSIFIIYPTIIERSEFIIRTFSDKLLSYSYAISTPTKSAPSLHVALSMLFILGTITSRELKLPYKIFVILVSVLIMISTMFVKQHYFVDVLSGIGVGIISWLIINIKFKKGNKK